MNYKNVLQLYKKSCDNLKDKLIDAELAGQLEWDLIINEFYGILDLLNDPIISEPLDNLAIEVKSKVDFYGVGSLIIALYEDGVEIEKIAEHLQLQEVRITPKEIGDWLSNENRRGILDKAINKYGDVFDTAGQLQRIMNKLEDLIDKVEREENLTHFKKTSKYEVLLQITAEIRKTVKDASDVTKTIIALQKIEKFKQDVLEEIKKESPECSQRIFKRMANLATIYGSMNL